MQNAEESGHAAEPVVTNERREIPFQDVLTLVSV